MFDWVSILGLCYSKTSHTATGKQSWCFSHVLMKSSSQSCVERSVSGFTGTEKIQGVVWAKRNPHFHFNLVKCRNTEAEQRPNYHLLKKTISIPQNPTFFPSHHTLILTKWWQLFKKVSALILEKTLCLKEYTMENFSM